MLNIHILSRWNLNWSWSICRSRSRGRRVGVCCDRDSGGVPNALDDVERSMPYAGDAALIAL